MKKVFSTFISIYMLASFFNHACAQEQIMPLTVNPVIAQDKSVPQSSLRVALALPFTDDFTYQSIYPDPAKWIDKQAFVNTTFPIDPPSIGVATLDGLNERGQPYDSLSHSFYSIGGADTLTSQPILLGGYLPSDSVVFSFFYQPGGLGDPPNPHAYNVSNFGYDAGDSLVLEFKDNAGVWRYQWAHDGFVSDTFHRKALLIKDASFLHDDFQFRFRNYASLIGQYDLWHIDYVEMDTVHNNFDTSTFLGDPAVQYIPTSILKNYEAMPWNQFRDYQSTEKADTITSFLRNNSAISENTSYGIYVYDAITGTVILDVNPSIQFAAHESLAKPFEFPQTIPLLDSAVIATRISVNFDPDKIESNDTVTRYQVFPNYMAYDDGTPEAVYRLLGTPAAVAMQYHLNEPDSLQAIQIMFAHTDVDLSANYISIVVWKSIGLTDSVMLRDDFIFPQFPNTPGSFAFIRLSEPLSISDTFYIGWQQVSLQSDFKMDVGFDFNDDAHQHLHFKVNGAWQTSVFPGALMIRPVLGKTVPFGIGIPEVDAVANFKIYPNPASDVIYVDGGNNDVMLEVLDYSGRTMLTANRQSSIDIRQLHQGMYLMRITDIRTGKTSIQKFVKTN